MKKAAVAVVLLAAVCLTAGGLVNGGFGTFVADVQAEGGTAEESFIPAFDCEGI